jgi:D-isomer specific 2-hydroxyacid dehydrogenase, NAD binding domain
MQAVVVDRPVHLRRVNPGNDRCAPFAAAAQRFCAGHTARAQLIEESALLQALHDGWIGHAALDVFPTEPLPPGNPYVQLPNVTLTSHAA